MKSHSIYSKIGRMLKKCEEAENFIANLEQSRSVVYYNIKLHKFLKKNPKLRILTLP